MSSSFTERVRQELARTRPDAVPERRAQLAAMFRLAGALHLRDSRLALELVTTSGATARAAFTLAHDELGERRPELRVHEPGGIRSSARYVVVVEDGVDDLGRALELVDPDGRPRRDPPAGLVRDLRTSVAFARGCVLASASFSAPGRPPHLELPVPNESLAGLVGEVLGRLIRRAPGVSPQGERWRVVVKSGEAIGTLLAALGATSAFLMWDEARLRRSLRGEANRLANADAANVRRSVEAAAAQVRAVQRAVAEVGWGGVRDDLRPVALARLANPEATLSELGELCDPPLSKSAVHRRLRRLESLAEDGPDEGSRRA